MAILVLLDQTVQQHNLECTKTAFHHGIGTNLCRYSTDLVGFLRNLVSRLITYLEAIKAEAIAAAKEEEARKEKEKRKKEVKQKKGETMLESDDDDEDDNNVDEPVDLLPRISCDNSTPRGTLHSSPFPVLVVSSFLSHTYLCNLVLCELRQRSVSQDT